MKKFLTLIPIFALILVCIPMASHANAAGMNSIDVTVTVPDSVKVGQTWDGVKPDITVAGTAGQYGLTVGTDEKDLWLSTNGQSYVQKNNTVYVTFCLYADVSEGMWVGLPEPFEMSFTVNGNEIPSDQVRKENGDNGQYYRVEFCEVNVDLSDRSTFSISADDTQYQGGYYVNLSNMPTEAEAGATITFCADFSTNAYLVNLPYEVEYYTLDGTQIQNYETFVMPERDVTVGAKVTDKYAGWEYVSEVDITLDFEDEDIYYGKKLPTNEDFFNALSVSCSIPGVNVYVRETVIDTLWDESTGGDLPWVGNQFLSFWIEVEDGYLLTNPYLSDYYMDEFGNESNPLDDWLRENLTVTVNGVQRNFALSMVPSETSGYVYADGYMVSDYYVSVNSIEIHVEWSLREEIDVDLSDCNVGDTVTIPDSVWIWDGYMPTGYILSYNHTEYGQMTDIVYGKSFVMPEADGEVTVLARGVRGKFNVENTNDAPAGAVLFQQSLDSEGHISLDVKEGTFPDVTVLQINKINEDDFYGGGYEVLDLVNRTLSDVVNDSVTFEITALSYNQEVQPTDKIIVTFPIPEGFDSDYIAFYHVDKNGTYEIVPAEIDKENGVCRAVIEHFSTYAIVSTKDASNLPGHIIHDLTLVPEANASCSEDGHCAYYTCSGCDKWFADSEAVTEIADKDSIYAGYESAGHAGGTATCSKKAVCTECQQEYGEYDPDNHVDTKVINAKVESCGEAGYTGDTYCNDCEKTVASGSAIFATGEHTYENGICSECEAIDPNFTPDSPATGDNSMIHIYVVLLALSALGIVALCLKSAKAKHC